MIDILVLMEKYCDLNPQTGVTSANSNIIGSLNCTNYNYDVFYYDEYFMNDRKPSDDHVLHLVKTLAPKIIFVSYYPFPNIEHNIKLDTFNQIRALGIKVVFIWFDFIHKQISDFAFYVSQYNDLNVIVDTYYENEKFLPMWVPQDEKLFYWQDDKPLPITFVGSLWGYYERHEFLQLLQQNHPDKLHISGGQREHKLTIEHYAQKLRQTKISLNFPTKPDGCVQAKSRIYESMLSGCLLMERENEAITKWFTPNEHYIPFNKENFMSQVNYYLENEEERWKIAKQGYNKMKIDYSAQNWWNKVFNN